MIVLDCLRFVRGPNGVEVMVQAAGFAGKSCRNFRVPKHLDCRRTGITATVVTVEGQFHCRLIGSSGCAALGGILAERFLLSEKCPLDFLKSQIVRQNCDLKNRKRDSVHFAF